MTTEDAKTYLSKREIPRLFESLMTGLMYHRPSDHIRYLIDCLEKVHEKGQENITWSSFVDIRRTKTPLPPISNGTTKPSMRPSSKTKLPDKEEKTFKDKISPSQIASSSQTDISNKVTLPDIPLVFVIGAPGSDKESHVQHLLNRYPGWQHLNVGTLLKEEIQRHGDAQSRWKLIKALISKGEPAPEDVTIDVLLEALKNINGAKGVIITGFPRSMKQVNEYEKFVSRVDTVFMIDCGETKTMDRLLVKGKHSNRPEDSMSAITNKINYFKAYTLPAVKHYDDQGKLIIIDGDNGAGAVRHDFGKSFDRIFFKMHGTVADDSAPMGSPDSVPEPATYKKKYEKEGSMVEDEKPLFTGALPQPPVIPVKDTGRKLGLPQCPIIFVAGGPGSGKGTQCKRIIERYPGFVHLSMGDIIRNEVSTKGTADEKWRMIAKIVSKGEMAPEDVTIDLLKQNLIKHSNAKAFLIEGFPRDKMQVEDFNKHIGGLNFVILFDCEEYYMQARLLKRGRDSGRIDDNATAISNRLNFYKYNTLPVMKYFEDDGKLVVLDADRDMEEMFFDISKMLDFAFFGQKSTELLAFQEKEEAAMNIQAIFHGYKVRNKEWEELSIYPKTDDEKIKAQGRKAIYMNEVQSHYMDESAVAVLQIMAGFVGSKQRQDRILKHAASNSSKREMLSSRSSHEKSQTDTKIADDKTRATMTIKAGFLGFNHRQKSEDRNTARLQTKAGYNDKKIVVEDRNQTAEAKQHIMAGFQALKTRQNHTQKPHNVSDADKAEAATHIQAGFRGYKFRQTMMASKESKSLKKDSEGGE